MRKLIAGMKVSLDAKMEGPEGFADWVDAWSEEYGLTAQIDACVLGGHMYPGYEQYWTAMQQNAPDQPLPMTGKVPIASEIAWARFSERTPHYVLSSTLNSANWPHTKLLRKLDDIADLKQRAGKDIYLMGGAQITTSCLEAGLLDEIRLLVYPLVAGAGKALFATAAHRHALRLRKAEALQDGRVSLVYDVG